MLVDALDICLFWWRTTLHDERFRAPERNWLNALLSHWLLSKWRTRFPEKVKMVAFCENNRFSTRRLNCYAAHFHLLWNHATLIWYRATVAAEAEGRSAALYYALLQSWTGLLGFSQLLFIHDPLTITIERAVEQLGSPHSALKCVAKQDKLLTLLTTTG